MSGSNVSESASNSDCSFPNAGVVLMSSSYLPNSQYCIYGSHNSGGQTSSSSKCLTSPAVSKVIHVNFEQIATGDLPIDTNPNASGGLRIFPDKKNPTDGENRRKIRVRAKIGANAAGVRIYFRNFDLDDPSANAAPIDVNGSLGSDNNGNVDGTVNTRAGQFSCPQPISNGCQSSTNSASSLTNAVGEAVVDFTLTMQPGDNFTVAVSPDENYLSNLALAADGINLKDTANIQTPVTTTANPYACNTSSVNACRADMLTVWRRLHIEVDSMGSVTGNKVEGTFPAIGKVGTGRKILPINVPPELEVNRFENGRIVIGSRSFTIIDSDVNASPPVNANTGNAVTINNNTGVFSISANQSFTLYDDDDFNDDGGVLDGDAGNEDVSEPDTSLLQPNDILCSSNAATGCNVFVSSYVRPVYDIESDVSNNNFFHVNVADDKQVIRDTFEDFDQIGTEQSQEFWTTYLYGGYQADVTKDADPDDQNGDGTLHGCGDGTYGVVDDIGPDGMGAIIFMENARPKEFPFNYLNRSVSRAWTAAHEVGHLLGGDHPEMGLMEQSCTRTSYEFDPRSITLFRKILNP